MARSTDTQVESEDVSGVPSAPPAARILCILAFAGLAYFLFLRGGVHIQKQWPDFEYFYKAGAWMLAHGGLDAGYDLIEGGGLERRGTIEWYLPFTHRLMTLFAWAPFVPAGAVWLILNLIAMFATLRMMGRYMMDLPHRDWPRCEPERTARRAQPA